MANCRSGSHFANMHSQFLSSLPSDLPVIAATVLSPDGRLLLTIETTTDGTNPPTPHLVYRMSFRGKLLIEPSALRLDLVMSAGSDSSYSPYAYGTSDLNYYGSFFNAPGYGRLWQPYFIDAGWDPFMNGAWAFNPGYGYGWVSGYLWGWTPYHYGSWVFLPSRGWAWQPGGSWAGWSTPRVLNAPAHFLIPQPPANSGQGILTVNRGPIPTPLGRSFNKLEIPNNSAGLGIPRGSIKSLGRLSRSVQQEGFATTKLHTAQIGGSSWWRGGYAKPNFTGGSRARRRTQRFRGGIYGAFRWRSFRGWPQIARNKLLPKVVRGP